jgi:hypothetical protein
MPMLAGRDFRATDRAGTSRVAIIGEATAHRLWPGRPVAAAVGESVEQLAFNPTTGRSETTAIVIVGVVGDPAYGTLIDGRNDIHVYVPVAQMPTPRTMLVVRTTDGRSVANEIRAALADSVRGLSVGSTRSAEEYSLLGLLPQRVGAFVTAALGLVGLLLATIGVYGVTASAIAQRRREIGIRVALGAPAAAITRMVLVHGMSLVLLGTVGGVPLAIAASQLLSSHLAGLPPSDPVTWSGMTLAFALMGLLACSAPLIRALRIAPAEILHET